MINQKRHIKRKLMKSKKICSRFSNKIKKY
jgi:hypothetical protein